jgi:hypothetical protein
MVHHDHEQLFWSWWWGFDAASLSSYTLYVSFAKDSSRRFQLTIIAKYSSR